MSVAARHDGVEQKVVGTSFNIAGSDGMQRAADAEEVVSAMDITAVASRCTLVRIGAHIEVRSLMLMYCPKRSAAPPAVAGCGSG